MNHKLLFFISILILLLIFFVSSFVYSEPLAIYFARNCTENYSINFTYDDFASNYDGEKSLFSVIFPELPSSSQGQLLKNGVPVTAYSAIPVSELDQLSFVPAKNFTGEITLYWMAFDGSEYSPNAAIQIAVEPSVKVKASSDLTSPTTGDAKKTADFPYADMDSHWAKDYAAETADLNILRGQQIGGKYYFNPEEALTRGDFVLLLNAALDISTAKPKNSTAFTDQQAIPAWLEDQGKIAYCAGILNGVSKHGGVAFQPNDQLTRIEAITMIDNVVNQFVETKGSALAFVDKNSVPVWGAEALQRMLALGVISGYTDNTIRPFTSINKGTAAKMICTMLANLPEQEIMQKHLLSLLSK